jgi:hypothetical protein
MLKDKEPKRGSFDYLLDGNSIHDEPPQPPRREGPGRIRIEIELTDNRNRRREAREARRNSWVFVGSVILLLIFLATISAHGEERWIPNHVGSQTYWYNPDTGERGQERRMPDGSTRSEWQDNTGRVTNCVVQKFGNAISRNCD